MRTRLRAGEPEAFREFAQAIHRHALRVSDDWSAAEEVVSLTFLEVWRLRERLAPGDDPVRPWVYGIATNVLHNRRRAVRRHSRAMSRLPAPDVVRDFSDETVERVDDRRRLAAVKTAVTRLPWLSEDLALRANLRARSQYEAAGTTAERCRALVGPLGARGEDRARRRRRVAGPGALSLSYPS
ncbi:sigma factor [Streptomyces sp. NPDC046870]|uniref:RNA polymerase sigma factor n=1 Tax=Streptomyces sp. NPDC046870 TaxID=3155135 RepID=UPI0034549E48